NEDQTAAVTRHGPKASGRASRSSWHGHRPLEHEGFERAGGDLPGRRGGYDVLCDFWLPRDMLPDRVKRHGVFDAWATEGYLSLTEGNVIDEDAIERRVRELCDRYQVEAIGCDPWNMARMLPRLQADNIPAVLVPKTIGHLTAATKALETLVLQGKLRHG